MYIKSFIIPNHQGISSSMASFHYYQFRTLSCDFPSTGYLTPPGYVHHVAYPVVAVFTVEVPSMLMCLCLNCPRQQTFVACA